MMMGSFFAIGCEGISQACLSEVVSGLAGEVEIFTAFAGLDLHLSATSGAYSQVVEKVLVGRRARVYHVGRSAFQDLLNFVEFGFRDDSRVRLFPGSSLWLSGDWVNVPHGETGVGFFGEVRVDLALW